MVVRETTAKNPTNLKRNNHYLPQCYQKGFADSSGKVWVWWVRKNKVEYTNPSAGRLRSLYIRTENGRESDSVETFFDKVIETPFALLSQRIVEERDQFRTISGDEQAALLKFIACQAVRTLAHKQCVDQQAGRPVSKEMFILTMLQMMRTITDAWLSAPPSLNFYTSLPYVGEQFITGDHPVVVTKANDNQIWSPSPNPSLEITRVTNLLADPRVEFLISLSPYVCVSLRMLGGGACRLPPESLDPQYVRWFNDLIRGQCNVFTLAAKKESLGRP